MAITSETGNQLTDDSGADATVRLVDQRAHEGLAWQADIEFATFLAETIRYALLRVGDDVPVLQAFRFTATDAPVIMKLYENPTLNADGSEVQVRNRNREIGADTDSLLVFSDANPSALGDLLDPHILTADKKVGGTGGFGPGDEWILARNTDYIIEVNNRGAQLNYSNLKIFWYLNPRAV